MIVNLCVFFNFYYFELSVKQKNIPYTYHQYNDDIGKQRRGREKLVDFHQ